MITYDNTLDADEVVLSFKKDGMFIRHNIAALENGGTVERENIAGFMLAIACVNALLDDKTAETMIARAAHMIDEFTFPAAPKDVM